MAPLVWQSSSAMGTNGGSGSTGEGNSSSQGQSSGTEYTLQGMACSVTVVVLTSARSCHAVERRWTKAHRLIPAGVMRFLQMEWHRHERDRNGWEIERAEMKARIAKLEGENRSSKKMQESLSNHIKLLENALRKERERIKSMSSPEDSSAGQKGGAKAASSGDMARTKRKCAFVLQDIQN